MTRQYMLEEWNKLVSTLPHDVTGREELPMLMRFYFLGAYGLYAKMMGLALPPQQIQQQTQEERKALEDERKVFMNAIHDELTTFIQKLVAEGFGYLESNTK